MTDRSRNVEEVLAAGTRIEEFVVERELQSGGFGVTYLAQDRSLGRRVAIKEYLPREWGGRRADGSVGPRSSSHEQDYRWGLTRFLEEARTLARLDHPRIVRVHRVIEAWGTAYMVMEYVEGQDLEEALQTEGPWPESRVRALLAALLPGLELVHEAGLVHRDIKPANVMLRGDGTPVLIDFGSARYAAGVHSRSLTSVLTPGYAPHEQYHQTAGKQGPWTDVYALGAVAYRALSGRKPAEAPARVESAARKQADPLAPVAQAAAGGVSEAFGRAVTAALAVWPEDRPRDVAAWRALWDDGEAVVSAVEAGKGDRRSSGGRSSRGSPGARAAGPMPGIGPVARETRETRIGGAVRRAAYGMAALVVTAVAVGITWWVRGGGAINYTPEATTRTAGGTGEFTPGVAVGDDHGDTDVTATRVDPLAPETPAEVPGTLDEPASPSSTSDVEAALRLDRPARRRIQRGLAAAGFDPGAPDGVFGDGTRAALERWQEDNGRPVTGYLEEEAATELQQLGRRAEEEEERAAAVERAAAAEALRRAAAEAEAARRAAEATLCQAEESRRPVRQRRLSDCESCPELVVIPAGTFCMGSPESEEGYGRDEGPRHEVTLRSFALGVSEVTFDEWDACVRGGGCGTRRPSDRGWGRGARPVINVSWDDAQAYVSWLSAETRKSYRLPSESEWEYAARAGTTTPFHTGAAISTEQANYRGERYRERTTPVRTFAPNAFGLYDVHGNVWEWVADCPSFTYRGAPDDGTAWTPGGRCPSRVLRGGSWTDPPPNLRSANRINSAVGARNFNAGFRVARALD